MDQMVTEILDKLDEYGIPVFRHYNRDDENLVISVDKSLLIYNFPTQELRVSFLVSTTPSHAATLVLILKEIDGISDIIVMESFVFKGEDLLAGLEATMYHDECIKIKIINEFMDEQTAMHMLATCETVGSC